MRNKVVRTISIVAVIFGLSGLCFAATSMKIAASIGETHQMNVALNKVNGSTWTPITDLTGVGMDFGALTKGTDNIFRSDNYFVVDAPVVSNKTTWTITHTRTDFASGTNNLNDSVNVKFIKVDNSTNAETLLALTGGGYVTYANSNSKVVNNSDITGCRLRIYYSIASGSDDATGAAVITTAKPTGTYTGTVTLTLSP